MSRTEDDRVLPKSMRHKQILDVAADNPDASLADIAGEVPSATPDLVERVLEEYGDPGSDGADGTDGVSSETTPNTTDDPSDMADNDTNDTTDSSVPENTADSESTIEPEASSGDDSAAEASSTVSDASEATAAAPSSADTEAYPSPEDLSEQQRETLRAIAANPEATQRELADTLDVTAATVSKRVNDINGFEWADRESFAQAVFDTDSTTSQSTMNDEDSSNPSTAALAERIERIEQQLEQLSTETEASTDPESLLQDPDLAHKVVHACMESEAISEEEELRILKSLLE